MLRASRKRRRRKRASALSCAAPRRLLLRTSCLCAMAKNAIASKHFLRMSGARTSVKTDFLISLLCATKKPAKRRVFMAQRGIFFGCASKASSAETGVCSFVRRAAPPPTSHFVLVRHGKKCNCKQAFFAHVGRVNLRENRLSHLSSLRHKKTRQKAGFHGAD